MSKKADLPLPKVLTILQQSASRNIQYSIISVLFSFGSIAVFGIIFLGAFFMHKKMKEWFPSEKDHKDAVKNINNDNTPDTKVEPKFAKEQQPANAANQLLQDAIKKQSQNNLNPGGNKNLQDFQQKSQSNINEEENPPVELSKENSGGNLPLADDKEDDSKTDDVGSAKNSPTKEAEENVDKRDNSAIQNTNNKNNKNQNKEFLNLQKYDDKVNNKTNNKALVI